MNEALDLEVPETAEAIVLDGANAVTTAPRQGFPDAGPSLAVTALVLCFAALAFGRSRWRWLVPVVLMAAVVPGTVGVLWARADAPLRRALLAAKVGATLVTLGTYARGPRSNARVRREDDDVLFPMMRYLLPARGAGPKPDWELEVRGSRLQPRCTADAASRTVVCGASP